ncbi:hypothetical protein B0H34DRAFT_676014 [Crassisporium funariophilum]|nr:hypothetical protein B0H34DRAFT_676014 [Crassisporium funariophilum]
MYWVLITCYLPTAAIPALLQGFTIYASPFPGRRSPMAFALPNLQEACNEVYHYYPSKVVTELCRKLKSGNKTQNKGAPGSESRTGTRLVSLAAGRKDRKWTSQEQGF